MENVNKINRWIVCRICLKYSETAMQKIFNDADDMGSDTQLACRIEECGGIQLYNAPNMPDSICAKCLLLLKAARKFRVTCQRSQQQLFKLLQLEFSPLASSALTSTVVEEVEDDEDQVGNESTTNIETNDAVAINYLVKEEQETSLHSSVDIVSDQDALGFAIDDDITEEYIELQSEPIDFLQDDETQNFVSDDMSYTHDQFVVVRTTDDSINVAPDDMKIVSSKITQMDETEGVEQQANAANDLNSSSGYKIVQKFSNSNCGSDRSLQRRRKVKKATGMARIEQGHSYICCYCGNMYLEKAKLTLHMKNHIEEKPHECEICHKRFSQTPQLTRHMNSHTGNRPFKCKYCCSCFADPSTCIKHERIHTNERPYKCETCGKTFSYSNVLKVHIMTHTGERPYSCEYCAKKFTQLHHKRSHERTHNQDLEVRSDYENLGNVGEIF